MAGTSLKEVENELDDLSIRILELMNDNIKCKMNIERAVRSGCIDLAKTRYILGNTHSVSAMKIPTEDLTATATILSSEDDGKLIYKLKQEKLQKSTVDQPKTINKDPLKWFGFLVPTNLRQGQSWFEKALNLSVQSANISSELSAEVDKFDTLMKEKLSLKSQVS